MKRVVDQPFSGEKTVYRLRAKSKRLGLVAGLGLLSVIALRGERETGAFIVQGQGVATVKAVVLATGG